VHLFFAVANGSTLCRPIGYLPKEGGDNNMEIHIKISKDALVALINLAATVITTIVTFSQ
jgi:hypothetical protein